MQLLYKLSQSNYPVNIKTNSFNAFTDYSCLHQKRREQIVLIENSSLALFMSFPPACPPFGGQAGLLPPPPRAGRGGGRGREKQSGGTKTLPSNRCGYYIER